MEKAVDRLRIRDSVGGLLVLRCTVAPFFQQLEQLRAKSVVVDFSGVEFLSRSFADEYLTAKAASKKQVQEVFVPLEAQKMLDMVSRQLQASKSGIPVRKSSVRRPPTVSL